MELINKYRLQLYMRTIFLIFILQSIGNNITAQEIYPTKNLDTYVGTWKYQSNDTIFKIVLQKGQSKSHYAVYDCLFGGYSLSVNNNIIEYYWKPLPISRDYSQPRPNNLYIWASNNSISAKDIDPNYIGVIFYDQKKKHFGGKGITGGYIRLLAPNRIQWKLDEKTGINNEMDMEERDEMIKPIGFSVPSDVIMIKED